jgi:hypothetical protein
MSIARRSAGRRLGVRSSSLKMEDRQPKSRSPLSENPVRLSSQNIYLSRTRGLERILLCNTSHVTHRKDTVER